MKVRRFAALAIATLAACASKPAPPAPTPVAPPSAVRPPGDVVPLFASDDVLEFTLECPIEKVSAERVRKVRRPYDGILRDPTGAAIAVQVKAAGRSRAERCVVPPLVVKVKEPPPADAVFAEQKTIRMATHCRDQALFEQYVIEEYLLYRVLNLVTDQSYRVRLGRITYRKSPTDRGRFHYVLLTEHETQLAARLGWDTIEIPKLTQAQVEPNQAALLGLFHFMVGNTDFSVLEGSGGRCCHNTQLIGASPDGPFIPVPYDFDSAGVIDTPFAAHSQELPSTDVKKRFYRGLCRHNAYLPELYERFSSIRDQVIELYTNQPGLNEVRRKKALNYYDAFFEIIGNPQKRDRLILRQCR